MNERDLRTAGLVQNCRKKRKERDGPAAVDDKQALERLDVHLRSLSAASGVGRSRFSHAASPLQRLPRRAHPSPSAALVPYQLNGGRALPDDNNLQEISKETQSQLQASLPLRG
jgi:hypothetical protein